jgi:hypothetical protein
MKASGAEEQINITQRRQGCQRHGRYNPHMPAEPAGMFRFLLPESGQLLQGIDYNKSLSIDHDTTDPRDHMTSRTQITWLEEWVAPGLCLLARCSVQGRSSLGTVQPKEATESGIWACVHEDDMALIEAPFPGEDSGEVLSLIDGFIAQNRVQLKYISATRFEAGRTSGLAIMLNHYRHSTFVFPQAWQVQSQNLSLDRQQFGFQQGLNKQWNDPKHQPYDNCLETQLAGERLFFFEAPYHTLTDQLVVFRGVALQPNWQLPISIEQPLVPPGAPEAAVRDSLTRLSEFEKRHRYGIHNSVAVSGKQAMRTDFERQTLMGYLRLVKGVKA